MSSSWSIFMIVLFSSLVVSQYCHKDATGDCEIKYEGVAAAISGASSEGFCQKDANSIECTANVKEPVSKVKVLTIATEKNHGFERYFRSAEEYGIEVKVLGLGEKWNGGDMRLYAGGGQKINILKTYVESIYNTATDEEKKNNLILFTDSYDVIFLSGLKEIVDTFKIFPETRVLFSAESYCWPDVSLASQYPKTKSPAPYLNSGGFIGYLEEIHKILSVKPVKDKEDDQLFYTSIYLDKELRSSLKISLDHNSQIFQNLNGAYSDVVLFRNESVEWPYVENQVTKTKPLILHGNGPNKIAINSLGNYLARAWSPKHGCKVCKEKKIEISESNLPEVMLALFVEQATPFFEEFLKSIEVLDYPKEKLHLFIRNNVEYHEAAIEEYVNTHSKMYASIKRIKPSDFLSEAEARNIAMERSVNTAVDYLFTVDSVARLKPHSLRYLISSGYDIVGPMLTRHKQMWSNFWGAINAGGFYARSADYMEIVNRDIVGIWNVPFITNCYLIKTSVLVNAKKNAITYEKKDVDPDMVFCESLRNAGIFLHISNEEDFGHLVNTEDFDISRTNPDVYELFNNRLEWEKRYLHENFSVNFEEGREHLMPCPDVYWFPLMSERFCKEWIEVMEAFGQWSDGTNKDDRIKGGYEAVPTRDIHMTQVGLEKQWLAILQDYVRPLQEAVFIGYFHNPPESIMNFVVRYRPDEQPSLRPHHDSSTYTINLALNTPNVDYEGGGCNFIRYKCAVRDTKMGWLLMHPGRLTHYHEGLLVTKGTRYIMISFVNP